MMIRGICSWRGEAPYCSADPEWFTTSGRRRTWSPGHRTRGQISSRRRASPETDNFTRSGDDKHGPPRHLAGLRWLCLHREIEMGVDPHPMGIDLPPPGRIRASSASSNRSSAFSIGKFNLVTYVADCLHSCSSFESLIWDGEGL